jgi:hypothetical protein
MPVLLARLSSIDGEIVEPNPCAGKMVIDPLMISLNHASDDPSTPDFPGSRNNVLAFILEPRMIIFDLGTAWGLLNITLSKGQHPLIVTW